MNGTTASLRPRSGTCPFTRRRAELSLSFVIIGAGIAGSALALGLARAGHHVHLLERYPGTPAASERPCGGIRVPPNMTKILSAWNLADALDGLTIRSDGSTFRVLETGETIGYLRWNDALMSEAGADFLFMDRGDLHAVLLNAAREAGVQITYGAVVTAVSSGPKPSVATADGTQIFGDIVVGADGSRSMVREHLLGRPDSGQENRLDVFTATVPVSAMRQDPDLSDLTKRPEWPMWMGEGRSILAYPTQRPEEVYTMNLFWPHAELDLPKRAEESWDDQVSHDIFHFEDYDPKLKKMLKLATSITRTKYVDREPNHEWVDPSHRIVLVGDAAHPLLPCSNHSASLSIEDAATMASLFSRLTAWDQVPLFLDAYAELRQHRCERVAKQEKENQRLVHLPPGPLREARDEMMRQTLLVEGQEEWDEGYLLSMWERISEQFGYNALEAADDWWYSWGVVREASKARIGVDLISIPVQKETEMTLC